MYVLLALLLLGVLITAHEAGHYLAARACGIEVQEFAMGMGPALLKWKNQKGTQFSLRAFPIGGFCQFYGEDREDDDPRSFNQQAIWKRFLTVVSGPLMNFIVAMLVIVLFLSALGLITTVPEVASLEENAAKAGLLVGDEILAVNAVPVETTNDVITVINEAAGGDVTLTVLRNGEQTDVVISPFYDEEAQRYRVGFSFRQVRERVPLTQSVPVAFEYNVQSATLIADTLKNLIFNGEGADQVAGPVGTVYVIQEVTQQGGIDVYLELLALISVNLGVMNLLPIPGLDGSRLIFLLVEAVRRKPVKREIEGMIHFGGFVLLMGLMVLLTYQDIMNIFVR